MKLPTGLCAQLACIWEASARKPGNVHRYRDFANSGYVDFLVSAAAVAPVLEDACRRRVGETVLAAIQATRQVTSTNTNLGIVLLLAPLAAACRDEPLRDGVARVLEALDREDARRVYEAIRLANPGGLGRVQQQDVHEEPTQTLRQVMALAADRDLVARQYASGFREVFDDGVPALLRGLEQIGNLEQAIISCHLRLLATYPDSLIARKRGEAEAAEASRRARRVLEASWPEHPLSAVPLAELDAWLCAAGHERNPGATADLVAASLFAALRDGMLKVPLPISWSIDSTR